MGEIFGEYLKSLRIDRKLTLRQLEEQTQISNGYLSQVERGERNPPTMKILVKLAKALGVPLSALSDKAEEELRRNREQAKESKEEEELKAKLPTEEEIKKLFDKFQLMVNGKCIGIPTWNYDDLAKSIRSLIEEKLDRKGE